MIAILILLILSPIFASSHMFHQVYYTPKLLLLELAGLLIALWLCLEKTIVLPSRKVLLFLISYLGLTAFSIVAKEPSTLSFISLAYILSGFLTYLAFLNFPAAWQKRFLIAIYCVAVIEALSSYIWPGGTFGNTEFLATFLGFSFFIGVHLFSEHKERFYRSIFWLGQMSLIIGVIIAQNKGGLFFLTAYFIWTRTRKPLLLGSASILLMIVLMTLFPHSLKGRIFLWLTSAEIFRANWLFGVGPGQFENSYFDAVKTLFSDFPSLKLIFGAHTATVLDPHNFFFSQAVDLGIGGFILSFLFFKYILQKMQATTRPLAMAAGFLLFKSLYTVVLTSVSGLILMALIIALLTESNELKKIAIPPLRRWTWAVTTAAFLIFGQLLTFSDFYLGRGMRLLFLGQQSEAIPALRQALNLNPQNSDAWLGIAQAGFQLRSHGLMDESLQRAMDYRKNMDTYKKAAHLYFYSRFFENASGIYSEISTVYPEHLTSIVKLALIYREQGDLQQAKYFATKALSYSPRVKSESDSRNLAVSRRILEEMTWNSTR